MRDDLEWLPLLPEHQNLRLRLDDRFRGHEVAAQSSRLSLGAPDRAARAPQDVPDENEGEPQASGRNGGDEQVAKLDADHPRSLGFSHTQQQDDDASEAREEERQQLPPRGICPALGFCHVRVPCITGRRQPERGT